VEFGNHAGLLLVAKDGTNRLLRTDEREQKSAIDHFRITHPDQIVVIHLGTFGHLERLHSDDVEIRVLPLVNQFSVVDAIEFFEPRLVQPGFDFYLWDASDPVVLQQFDLLETRFSAEQDEAIIADRLKLLVTELDDGFAHIRKTNFHTQKNRRRFGDSRRDSVPLEFGAVAHVIGLTFW
jgi:hypothetical protein